MMTSPSFARAPESGLRVAGLFAGIGGFELGLGSSGHTTTFLCEIDPDAQRVLRKRFPAADLRPDITRLKSLPEVDLVTAGFPCQDISPVGALAGIEGERSGLVSHVFRLLKKTRSRPSVLIENVSFLLSHNGGLGIRYLVNELEELGYTWAYRVVDTRSFGKPQRRLRVFLFASTDMDPREVLFADDADVYEPEYGPGVACGFYWTEGNRGLGWAVDAVPTLKGGSGWGIPSPPAIWMPDGAIVTPDIRDAERLQGFPVGWTNIGDDVKRGARWRMVGNAVSVPSARWIGHRLRHPGKASAEETPIDGPRGVACWGYRGKCHQVDVGRWPKSYSACSLDDFLIYDPIPLSTKATKGFRERLKNSSLNYPPEFLEDLYAHEKWVAKMDAA